MYSTVTDKKKDENNPIVMKKSCWSKEIYGVIKLILT
jgi:hypothetical protein